MGKKQTRRISRIANVTAVAVVALVLFEVVMISGAIELKAQTVAKYAPWAYEPFLRLVGEHPESPPHVAVIAEEEPEETDPVLNVAPDQTGLMLDIPVVAVETNVVLDSSVPVEPTPEEEALDVPTNAPVEEVEEVLPVG